MHDRNIEKQSDTAFIDAFNREDLRKNGDKYYYAIKTDISLIQVLFSEEIEEIGSEVISLTVSLLKDIKRLNAVTGENTPYPEVDVVLNHIIVCKDDIEIHYADKNVNGSFGAYFDIDAEKGFVYDSWG
jgi:hypothetical protein